MVRVSASCRFSRVARAGYLLDFAVSASLPSRGGTSEEGLHPIMAKPVVATPKTEREKLVTPASTPFEIDITATGDAWKVHLPEFLAIARSEVIPASLDVTRAASIAIAATKNVLSRSEYLHSEFKNFPETRIRRVLSIALAVQHGDLLHRVSQDKTSLFADIFPRMTELRGIFVSEMETQVRRGKCPQKTLDDVRAGDRDAADFANDLNDVAAWFEVEIARGLRTTVTDEEIAEARKLAATALARIGSDLVANAKKANEVSTSERRARAFTALAREYDLVQKYGSNAFWSEPGGWEQYVPSLWTGRNDGPIAPKTPPTPPQPPTG